MKHWIWSNEPMPAWVIGAAAAQSQERARLIENDEVPCMQHGEGPTAGGICTRAEGHTGLHVATGPKGRIMAAWGEL